MKHNLNHAYAKLDWFVIFCVFMFPVTFLTVRHGVHVSLFALLLVAAYQFWHAGLKNIQLDYPRDLFILLIFSGLLISVLISQIFRGAIHTAAFDGPSRILFAGIIFIFLKQSKIPYIKILALAIPLGLLCVFASLQANRSVYWGSKYATYFVDPNSLGAQSLILGMISFALIGLTHHRSKIHTVLLALGGLIGIFISIGCGSRGAWLALPFIASLMCYLSVMDLIRSDKNKNLVTGLNILIFLILVLGVAMIGVYFFGAASERIISAYRDLSNWLNGSNMTGSVGERLTIWMISFDMISWSPWFGFGEKMDAMQILKNSSLDTPFYEIPIQTMMLTGPHSDILSKLLSAGIFGLASYLALMLLPFAIFWQHRNAVNLDIRMTSRIGLYYIVGVFIAGLSNEQLSLKYLCTFYGLMIAVLLAQVLHKPSAGRIN